MLLHHPKPEADNKESNNKHFILATAKAKRRIYQDAMAHPQGSDFTAKSQAAWFLSQMLTTEGPTKQDVKF